MQQQRWYRRRAAHYRNQTTCSVTLGNSCFWNPNKGECTKAEATGHDLKAVEKKRSRLHQKMDMKHTGECQTCKKLFSDEAGTVEISNPIEIKATGHNLESSKRKMPAALTDGHEAYWNARPAKSFSQTKLELWKSAIRQQIKATGHDLKVARERRRLHRRWIRNILECDTCKKLFSDEAGTVEISNPTAIKATGHDLESSRKERSRLHRRWTRNILEMPDLQKAFLRRSRNRGNQQSDSD